MKTYAVLLFVVLFASPISGQQHALTGEQCRADVAAWAPATTENSFNGTTDLEKLLSPTPDSFQVSSSRNASVEEITARVNELSQCANMEKYNDVWQRHYRDAILAYMVVSDHRMRDYLKRKHLWEQFVDEDKQGRR